MSLTGFLSYSRVNWQQSPSKSTPLSATNLNVMDAGIKNNNDMISNIRDEITQLNNNIGNIIKYIDVVYPSITISSNQWTTIINDSANKEIYDNNLAGKTVYNAQLVSWNGDDSTPYNVSSNGIYIIGNTGGVFKDITIRYFYY